MEAVIEQPRKLDRISEALARRREQVALDEERAKENARHKATLNALLSIDKAKLADPGVLLGLLYATWERLPTDLSSVAWESPSATNMVEAAGEIIAIGTKVADAIEVSKETAVAVAEAGGSA